MRGQFGLRLRARQNGRLLHRILHRLGEVVFGHPQRVLRRFWNSFGQSFRPALRDLLPFNWSTMSTRIAAR